VKQNDDLDLDGGIERELSNAHRRSSSPSSLAQDIDKELTCAIHNASLIGKTRSAIDEANGL
jgi:hypothetical protein